MTATGTTGTTAAEVPPSFRHDVGFYSSDEELRVLA